MPKILINTQVVGFISDSQLWLEGQETKLSYDGNKTRKSTDEVDVKDGVLNILLHCVGFAGTDWEITVNQLKPAQELFKQKGTIEPIGHSLLAVAVKL